MRALTCPACGGLVGAGRFVTCERQACRRQWRALLARVRRRDRRNAGRRRAVMAACQRRLRALRRRAVEAADGALGDVLRAAVQAAEDRLRAQQAEDAGL